MTLWIEKIQNAKSLEELENLRVDTLGKKGVLTIEFTKMKERDEFLEYTYNFGNYYGLSKADFLKKLNELEGRR